MSSTSVGVILVDLDRFKSINDTYGHLVGDEVLREAAQFLKGSIRPYDAVGRLGGEEFLIVLPGCDQINAVSHAERLRTALSRVSVDTLSGSIHVTASFGVTVVGPETRVDAKTAIRIADSAMYVAKHSGRDRVEFSEACDESACLS
jgi:two-component system, cell cycle response regulator